MENTLILLKGITCAGKSTLAKDLQKEYNAMIISSDDIREELGLSINDDKGFIIAYERAKDYLSDNKNVIIDSTNLTKKDYYRGYNVLTNVKQNVKLQCNYVIVHPYIWIEQAKKKSKTKWLNIMSIDDIIELRQRMYESITYPIERYDNISFNIRDIDIKLDDINKFKHFYSDNMELFINDTGSFILKGIKENAIQSVLPEIMSIIDYNQQNSHHSLTLDKHTFKVCDNLPKTEGWKWMGLLHDIGKVIEGIKRPKEGNELDFSYRGHAGASAEMSICILNRLGFNQEFINKVVPIINYHMYLPYDGNTLNKKTIHALRNIYNDLVIFREADLKGK